MRQIKNTVLLYFIFILNQFTFLKSWFASFRVMYMCICILYVYNVCGVVYICIYRECMCILFVMCVYILYYLSLYIS